MPAYLKSTPFREPAQRADRIARAASIIIMLSTLVACAQEPGQDTYAEENESSASTSAMPDMYIDRELEQVDASGANPLLEGYRQRLAICRDAGLPTRPLGDQDVARLGKERWQMWRSKGRLAMRAERWEEGSGDIAQQQHCQFSVRLSGSHDYADTQRRIFKDLATGETQVETSDPALFEMTPFDSASENEAAKWRGWSGPSERRIAGQPCVEWRSPSGDSVCRWSGGAKWGFDHGNQGLFLGNTGMDPYSIELDAKPAPGTGGVRLTTHSFMIGNSVNLDGMQPQAGEGG